MMIGFYTQLIFVGISVRLPLCVWGILDGLLFVRSQRTWEDERSIGTMAIVWLYFSALRLLRQGLTGLFVTDRLAAGCVDRYESLGSRRLSIDSYSVEKNYFLSGNSCSECSSEAIEGSLYGRPASFANANQWCANLSWNSGTFRGRVVDRLSKVAIGHIIHRSRWGRSRKRLLHLLGLLGKLMLFVQYQNVCSWWSWEWQALVGRLNHKINDSMLIAWAPCIHYLDFHFLLFDLLGGIGNLYTDS